MEIYHKTSHDEHNLRVFLYFWLESTWIHLITLSMCRGSWVPTVFLAWLLSTVIKPGQGLVTGTTLLHLLVKRIPNGNGVSACTDAMHAHPTQKLYKRVCAPCPWVHFWLAIGRDTSWTTTLAIGATKHLVHVNKQISLVAFYFCLLK